MTIVIHYDQKKLSGMKKHQKGSLDLLINLDFRMAEQRFILISSYLLQLGMKSMI